jgi:hypothetical protein
MTPSSRGPQAEEHYRATPGRSSQYVDHRGDHYVGALLLDLCEHDDVFYEVGSLS